MPTVFLSHSSKDKSFALKLATMLKDSGVNVWIDEAELKVGDSLIHKLSSAINETDYVVVILSHNSVKSSWVQKELALAIQKEISEKKIKVLPILKEPCDIPIYMRDKLYADFTNPISFEAQFVQLINSLGIEKNKSFHTDTESKVINKPTLESIPKNQTDYDSISNLPMPSQELSDEMIVQVLDQLPRGPAVEFYLVTNNIIDHFGVSLSELESGQLVARANRLRCMADPNLRARSIIVTVAGNIQLIGR